MILTKKEVSTEPGAIQARVRIDHLAGGAADSGTVAHFPVGSAPCQMVWYALRKSGYRTG